MVDNGSSDGSVAWLRSAWPDVKVLELGQNLGYAAACNRGATAASAPVVMFHNNDAIVRPGWSAALCRALESTTDTVIAGGLTLFLREPSRVNSAGIRIAISGAATDIGFARLASEMDLTERDVAGVSGVSMAVQRRWFEAAGGFDEDYFMYFEDADLCLRAWVEGYRVRFTPDAVVLHAFGATSGDRTSELRHYYGSRNRLLTVAKSFGVGSLILAAPLCIAQDLGVVVWLLASGQIAASRRAAKGKFRGTVMAARAMPDYLFRKRSEVTRKRSVRDLQRLGIVDSVGASLREFARMRRVGPAGVPKSVGRHQ